MAWYNDPASALVYRRRKAFSIVTDSTATSRDVTLTIPVGWDDFWAAIDDDGYGVTVRDEIKQRTGRVVGIGSVYATLDRLQRKGWAESSVGPPEPVRGGRTKTLYRVTPSGLDALRLSRQMVERMTRGLELSTPKGASS